MKHLLKFLPSVDELQRHHLVQRLFEEADLSLEKGTKFIQQTLNEIRQSLIDGQMDHPPETREAFRSFIVEALSTKIHEQGQFQLKRVINGTGVVIHTNLGRSRLSEGAIERVVETSRNYSNLEYDTDTGKRGSRHSIIEQKLTEVCGSEAAMVVNNNAAAVYLILRALAKNQEVIVSRGELVEIGGSFRVSSIMEESGANLVEVGTTNKTHVYDYERATTEDTAMFMKVHTSNFYMQGFTSDVSTSQLAELAKLQPSVLVYEDLGSGSLFPFKHHGIGSEPVVKEALNAGADIVSFSGDKLLGGPQAGIIAGDKYLIDKLKRHQLARVLRVDKMTLAALEATLSEYQENELNPATTIPTVRDTLASKVDIEEKAKLFRDGVVKKTNQIHIDLKETVSRVGGGTMPEVERPTVAAVLESEVYSAEACQEKLRKGEPSFVTRVHNEQVWIDFRTIEENEISECIDLVSQRLA
ncbi:L-seryl-tRNA(Sec) selenium transferase [Texcoconibacillus texcoconensis]|uniref:L-seryl-tRNA(Sec) selenium transferase n=1 Tax=Texcoconibacillus texcoconensis TaxID=1095777 RepID=A0A840QSG3_9BACI|nr:L-seryl-tRNA(Sec) selenium transferase [Texcoconibacillus texcoconensis]MBB5174456.1 L-seryl-tRNA(Ser) seleniumtransferase [Texcoconibacillus texcoconensis]